MDGEVKCARGTCDHPGMTCGEAAEVQRVVADEVADVPALVADLKEAQERLGQAFNRLSASTEPNRCVLQGVVETALSAVEDAVARAEDLA